MLTYPRLPMQTPRHRTILALDIEGSTSRTDPVKAYLRDMLYDLLEQALYSGALTADHCDPFVDRGSWHSSAPSTGRPRRSCSTRSSRTSACWSPSTTSAAPGNDSGSGTAAVLPVRAAPAPPLSRCTALCGSMSGANGVVGQSRHGPA